ncbi:prepilin-type N-terminal cleavage/methylation domain-containing protein [Methyloglobulus morosus]|uniref:prepilin-type N-terminal cleavage/methylation domain-containing protein n=1 Tax=Methyloglobulus morosus TaxID=1410681 RepID=UPI00055C4571|nr:prepilin-type N-terminal cleavage/methylation domain-containing protein [Methyloglobulus morosus]
MIHKSNAGGNGFTLLELLTALAVIGVLSAIAIPTYNGYIEKININKAISDINFIQVCIERYHTETFDYPSAMEDIAGCLPNNGIDPWGKPYVYFSHDKDDKLKGKDKPKGEDKGDDQRRQDGNENPINTLYDLYSKGKDGLSKKQLTQDDSKDDVIVAHDGAFIGLASDF